MTSRTASAPRAQAPPAPGPTRRGRPAAQAAQHRWPGKAFPGIDEGAATVAAAAAGPPGEVEAPCRWPRTRDRDGPRPGPDRRGLPTVRNAAEASSQFVI